MLGVAVTWIGAAPSAEDLASGSKRRRGRGGRQGARPHSGRARRATSPAGARRNGARPRAQKPARVITRELRRLSRLSACARKSDSRSPRRHEAEPVAPPARRRAASVASGSEASGAERTDAGQSLREQSEAALGTAAAPIAASPRRSRPSPVGLGDHVPAFLKKGSAPDAALRAARKARPGRPRLRSRRRAAPPRAPAPRPSQAEDRKPEWQADPAAGPAPLAGRPVSEEVAALGLQIRSAFHDLAP